MMLSCLVPGFESLLKTGCSEVVQCADKGHETKIPHLFRFIVCSRCFSLLSVWIPLLVRAHVPNRLGDHPPGADVSRGDAKDLST